jgi:hypothetical protein
MKKLFGDEQLEEAEVVVHRRFKTSRAAIDQSITGQEIRDFIRPR